MKSLEEVALDDLSMEIEKLREDYRAHDVSRVHDTLYKVGLYAKITRQRFQEYVKAQDEMQYTKDSVTKYYEKILNAQDKVSDVGLGDDADDFAKKARHLKRLFKYMVCCMQKCYQLCDIAESKVKLK